jgi:hypothetical protein
MTFKDELPDGYEITPSWIAPAVLAASSGIASQLYHEITIMDDIGTLTNRELSVIPEVIREKFREEGEEKIKDNINDYIPDSYCDGCHRGDCENCDRGNCDTCDGYYSSEDIQRIKQEAFDRGYDEGKEEGIEEGREEVIAS